VNQPAIDAAECFAALLDERDARGRFERGWAFHVGRVLRRVRRAIGGVLSRRGTGRGDQAGLNSCESSYDLVENNPLRLVYLPHHLVSFARPDSAPVDVQALVDALEGNVSLGQFGEREIHVSPTTRLHAAKLDIEDARRLAEEAMIPAQTSAAQKSGRGVVDVEVADVRLVHYPFWVYYFARGRGKLDVRLLDAISGKPVGPRVKSAFLAAITERQGDTPGAAAS